MIGFFHIHHRGGVRAAVAALTFFTLIMMNSPSFAEHCVDIYVFESERIVDGGGIIIDVRQPVEYDDCHIPGSVNIPADKLGDRLLEIQKEAQVILYCRTARRSAGACNLLQSAGFRNVYNLTGGIIAWYNTGRALEGRCEGRPYFMYDSQGNVIVPIPEAPTPEPEIKGCK